MTRPHWHRWELVGVEHFKSYAGGPTSRTRLLQRCYCGKTRTKDIRGRWTVEMLKGRNA